MIHTWSILYPLTDSWSSRENPPGLFLSKVMCFCHTCHCFEGKTWARGIQFPLTSIESPNMKLGWSRDHLFVQMYLLHSNTGEMPSGPLFNIKMSSYQYRRFHCGDKTILRPSYLHNGISYTGKTSLYWIGALIFMLKWFPCLLFKRHSVPDLISSHRSDVIYIEHFSSAL